MIDIIEIYHHVLDNISKEENGRLSYSQFNRLSQRAELRLLDYLTSDIENEKPPMMYLSQKNKDFLSPFITPFPTTVVGGFITKPSDYYMYENMYRIGGKVEEDCDPEVDKDCNTVIELLEGSKFNKRCATYINDLQPSLNKPIAKEVGNKFQFSPHDLGSVKLEYLRYPKFGIIVTKEDPVYKDVVPDKVASNDYEWGGWATEYLIYFITQGFGVGVREQALLQGNELINKNVRANSK